MGIIRTTAKAFAVGAAGSVGAFAGVVGFTIVFKRLLDANFDTSFADETIDDMPEDGATVIAASVDNEEDDLPTLKAMLGAAERSGNDALATELVQKINDKMTKDPDNE